MIRSAPTPAAFVACARAIPRLRPLELVAPVLLTVFLFNVFVGLGFIGDGEAGGVVGLIDKTMTFGMLGAALGVIATRPELAARIAARAWPVWLVVGLCVVSLAWSLHPGHSVKRVFNLVALTIVGLGIATAFDGMRRLHATALAAFAAIIAADFASMVVMPDFAHTEIGVRGLHLSKNMAGLVAMIAFTCAAAWLIGAQRLRDIAAGLGVMALSLAFLLVTQSKTSLGLAVLIIAVGTPFAAAWRASVAAGVAATVALGLAAAGATLAAGVANWGWGEVLNLTVGDPTFSLRTDIWRFVSDEIAARPLLGAGYGAFWDVGAADDPLNRAQGGSWLSQVEGGVINQAHNGYLDLALQIGVPGAALAGLVAFGWICAALGRVASEDTRAAERGALLFCFLALTEFMLHNMMEASLFARTVPFGQFATLLGFVVAREQVEAARRPTAAPDFPMEER